ncbi:MAG: xanthine dehydrogenase family protein molybdopterin-binding subunit [Candidatus Bathyarchaeia archaeon]
MSESNLLVKGAGRYVDDIKLPNILYMMVARSPYAHARIISVKGGLNGNELKLAVGSAGEGSVGGGMNPALQHPALAQEKVYYAGQPVAAVFADDRYEAEDKLDEVEVEYEKLKPAMNVEESLAASPMHPRTQSNVISQTWVGNDFEDPNSPVVLEDEFANARIANNSLEPHGLIADFDGSRLTVYISTQSVNSMQEGISASLKIDRKQLHVIQADTGGAFGSKSAIYPEYIIASYAAMKFKRPIKWVASRNEELTAMQPGRGVQGKIKLFADRKGKVAALRGEVTVDAGAYGGTAGSRAPFFISMQMTGPYGIEKARVLARAVMTNKPPQGPYRGAGRPEAAFFMERMMDLLADELGLEADEVRLINTTTEPFKSPLGIEIDASRPFFTKAVTDLKYRERSKSENAGLGFFTLVPGFISAGESARIIVKDGKVNVWLGGNQHGQEHYVFVRKLLKDELGIPEELVMLNHGDTDMLEGGVGTWGSRSAIVGGAAIVAAARKLKAQVEKKWGKFSLENLLSGENSSEVWERPIQPQLNSFGAELATVDIDKFGMVKVKECVACYDVGRSINPKMVESQIIGGTIQGIGQVLYEEVIHDAEGNLATKNLFEAGLPTAENMPTFSIQIVENPSFEPHHAKGLGEAPTIGVPIALVRAIEKVSGKRIRHTPVKPEELIE